MERCIHCHYIVWPWQRATDPAGNVRNGVHINCRKFMNDVIAGQQKWMNDMCDFVGAPHPGDLYAIFGGCSLDLATYNNLIIALREKYGLKSPTKNWVLHDVYPFLETGKVLKKRKKK